MPLLYSDPEHWRQRAEEARERARTMADPLGRQQMLGIAEIYERLAARAVERPTKGAGAT
jgi:hypothetical protein